MTYWVSSTLLRSASVDSYAEGKAMIHIEGSTTTELANRQQGKIAKPNGSMTVGMLERKLLSRFPAEDAEEWDHTGLLVGDPASSVKGVACALDATLDAVRRAHQLHANVLVTHHPAFLDPPTRISPSYAMSSIQGAVVYEAIKLDVALMNFHTALDVSDEAAHMLPGMLGLRYEGVIFPCLESGKGYGQLCSVRESEKPLTLAQLAARCLSVFGRQPRVWGDMTQRIEHIATATGAAGNVIDACIECGVDCLVAGEVKYHAALDASQAGLSIIELGHDTSELPLATILAAAVANAGVKTDCIDIIDQSGNWTCPEATRI